MQASANRVFHSNLVLFGKTIYDQWIIGAGASCEEECIIHMATPPFIVKFRDYDIEDDETPDFIAGKSVTIGNRTFYDILWFNIVPENEAILLLLIEASTAIDYSDWNLDI